MDVKTFTARTMDEALQVVRNRLGANAVVLHTRSYKRGGVLGIGAKAVVEVTAADGREVGRRSSGRPSGSAQRRSTLPPGRKPSSASAPKQRPHSTSPESRQGLAGAGTYQTRPATPRAGAGTDQPHSNAFAGDLIRKTYQAAQAQMHPPQSLSATAQPQSPFESHHATGNPLHANANDAGPANANIPNVQSITGADADQLSEEMQAVRQLVSRMLHEQTRQNGALPQHSSRDQLFQQYMMLIEQEMAEELAGEIVEKARADRTDLDWEDASACRQAVRNVIAAELSTDEEASNYQPTEDGRPRTLALVGPTGVGKTTTVAKLAADFKLKQNRRVGMLTIDTYRIAAVDQLKTYAGIIGVPLEVVSTIEQMNAALDRLCDREVILIDTAGRSQRDEQRLEELAQLIDAAKPHETHLVLSSTSTQKVLLETVERFSKLQADRVLFTKLDEAVTFGTLATVARKVDKKLSYITTGQEVPHHIERGKSGHLASLVVGETRLGETEVNHGR